MIGIILMLAFVVAVYCLRLMQIDSQKERVKEIVELVAKGKGVGFKYIGALSENKNNDISFVDRFRPGFEFKIYNIRSSKKTNSTCVLKNKEIETFMAMLNQELKENGLKLCARSLFHSKFQCVFCIVPYNGYNKKERIEENDDIAF